MMLWCYKVLLWEPGKPEIVKREPCHPLHGQPSKWKLPAAKSFSSEALKAKPVSWAGPVLVTAAWTRLLLSCPSQSQLYESDVQFIELSCSFPSPQSAASSHILWHTLTFPTGKVSKVNCQVILWEEQTYNLLMTWGEAGRKQSFNHLKFISVSFCLQ